MKKEKGYLMIEILVLVLIFSVAIITLTALQTKSYTGVNSANYRGMAVNYSQNLLDKIRANKTGMTTGAYLAGVTNNNKCQSYNFNVINSVISCNSTQLAQDDLYEFNSVVTNTLPSGAWVLCIDSSNSQGTPTTPNCDGIGNNYVIKVFWKDKLSKSINQNNGYSQVIISTQI